MDVINESEFSIEELTKQTLKSIRLSGKRLLILIFLDIAFIIAGLVLSIIAIVNKQKFVDFLVISSCFVIMLLMLLYFKFGYPKSIKKTYKNNFGEGVKYKYVFHINRFDCNLISLEGNNKATINYDALKKIVEDRGIIRLYIEKRNFLPVKIENFKPDEFIKIQKAMQNSKTKYIIKK